MMFGCRSCGAVLPVVVTAYGLRASCHDHCGIRWVMIGDSAHWEAELDDPKGVAWRIDGADYADDVERRWPDNRVVRFVDSAAGPVCSCTPVPPVATLDGKEGWLHLNEACPVHGNVRR